MQRTVAVAQRWVATVFVLAWCGLTLGVPVSGTPRVAVAEFRDDSQACVANLGRVVADKLADRLAQSGLRVVPWVDLETFLRDRDLDASSPQNLSAAARAMGIDLLVVGTVNEVHVQETSLRLGILHVGSARVSVEISTNVVDPAGGAAAGGAKGLGAAQGTLQFALDLETMLFPQPFHDVCGGGFRAERQTVAEGQLVSLGYANAEASDWFAVEIAGADGTFVRLLGWQFVSQGECGTWFWNQRDGLGMPVSPGLYAARLWDGEAYAATVSFQVRPGPSGSISMVDAVTAGTPAFEQTLLGEAVNEAVGQLATAFLKAQPPEGAEPAPRLAAETPSETRAVPLAVGYVASVLPDGRVSVNIGASAGISVGDRMEIFIAEDVSVDPTTLEVLGYTIVVKRGEIVVVEVRDRALYGVRVGAFDPLPGDIARLANP